MKIKGLNETDFVNYKLISLFIIFPYCSFKCEKDCGRQVCQNSTLAHQPVVEIGVEELYEKFAFNPITKAVVCGGLEPLDSYEDLINLIDYFRNNDNDAPFVIYTGYTEEEVVSMFPMLLTRRNIVMKYGRFVPDQESHYDEVLGVKLASPNQYGKEYNYD